MPSRREFLQLVWSTGKMNRTSSPITLFLCGDIMTGRGIDQILPHPAPPRIYESYVKSAVEYVELAEARSGPIPRRASFTYPWGDALAELDRRRPDVRIANLETSITTSEDAVPKGINYRMHPANAPVLSALGLDCCSVANNHILDWGYRGLADTLSALRTISVMPAGAGADPHAAAAPALLQTRAGVRVLAFAFGAPDSGVPAEWAATQDKAGVAFIPDLSQQTAARIAADINRSRRPGDLSIVSVHIGPNWGYEVPADHRAFAHHLIDEGAADILYGHSSHHPKPIEVYRNRLILYGCGDFLNDYEGISGYQHFRSHLVLMYFATIDARTKALLRLQMKPLETVRFRLQHTTLRNTRWLRDMLNREGARLGTGSEVGADGSIDLTWPS